MTRPFVMSKSCNGVAVDEVCGGIISLSARSGSTDCDRDSTYSSLSFRCGPRDTGTVPDSPSAGLPEPPRRRIRLAARRATRRIEAERRLDKLPILQTRQTRPISIQKSLRTSAVQSNGSSKYATTSTSAPIPRPTSTAATHADQIAWSNRGMQSHRLCREKSNAATRGAKN